jgi:hypothetical protein
MKKLNENRKHDELRPEYDFASMRGGVRAKYYEEYRKERNVVRHQADVAEAFPTEAAVNEALRGILSFLQFRTIACIRFTPSLRRSPPAQSSGTWRIHSRRLLASGFDDT